MSKYTLCTELNALDKLASVREYIISAQTLSVHYAMTICMACTLCSTLRMHTQVWSSMSIYHFVQVTAISCEQPRSILHICKHNSHIISQSHLRAQSQVPTKQGFGASTANRHFQQNITHLPHFSHMVRISTRDLRSHDLAHCSIHCTYSSAVP